MHVGLITKTLYLVEKRANAPLTHPFTNMASPKPILTRKLLLGMMNESTNGTMDSVPSHLATSSSQGTQGFYLISPYQTKTHIDFSTIIVFTALFIAFSLLGFFSVYLRRWYALRHTNNGIPIGDQSPPPSHQGLHPLILQTLPHFTFSSSSSSSSPFSSPSSLPLNSNGKKKKKTSECAICLEEFGDEEVLRLLPACGHFFHSQCIHTWLFSHTTCPLCRHSLLPHSLHNPTGGGEGERERESGNQYSSTQESSVLDMEAPSQSVTLQMDVVIECKEGESSTHNTALKPKKLRNGGLRRSYSMGRCLIMKEEGEGSQSSSLKAINMKDQQLRRSSALLSYESLIRHHPHPPHRPPPLSSDCWKGKDVKIGKSTPPHPLSSDYWKGKDVKIGRSRSFCLKFVKASSSDRSMKRRFDDGECPPSSSPPPLPPPHMQPTSSSVKKRTLTRFLSAKEPFYCQPKQEHLPSS